MLSLLFSSLCFAFLLFLSRDVQFRFVLALSQGSAKIKGFLRSRPRFGRRKKQPAAAAAAAAETIRNIFNHCAACKAIEHAPTQKARNDVMSHSFVASRWDFRSHFHSITFRFGVGGNGKITCSVAIRRQFLQLAYAICSKLGSE